MRGRKWENRTGKGRKGEKGKREHEKAALFNHGWGLVINRKVKNSMKLLKKCARFYVYFSGERVYSFQLKMNEQTPKTKTERREIVKKLRLHVWGRGNKTLPYSLKDTGLEGQGTLK